VLVLNTGFVGIALSTALAAWVNVLLLYSSLHRREHLQLDARFKAKALRIIGASIAMGAALLALNPWLDPYMGGNWPERIGALVALCGIGGAVYGAAVLLLGGASLGELRRQFTRKK
jgi:putative peptidoglycan lipid II flippase